MTTRNTPSPFLVLSSSLVLSIDGISRSIIPEGEGYLRVPSCFPQHGYVQFKVYSSSHLAGNVIDEEDFMGIHKLRRCCYSSLTLQKFYSEDTDDTNTWELTISNRSTNILDNIMITGIQNAQDKYYTQPLLFPSYITILLLLLQSTHGLI